MSTEKKVIDTLKGTDQLVELLEHYERHINGGEETLYSISSMGDIETTKDTIEMMISDLENTLSVVNSIGDIATPDLFDKIKD